MFVKRGAVPIVYMLMWFRRYQTIHRLVYSHVKEQC